MNEAISRRIMRLCHFTPSRNLVHIAGDRTGVLATKHLTADERKVFTQTDLKRLDGHGGHICCSVEYPNGWYFAKARASEVLFQDWVVLLIQPHYLWADGTLFCARNAAAGYGAELRGGTDAFMGLFADCTRGAYGKSFRRGASHLDCSPTDDQAEVLVEDRIELSDICGIGVCSDAQARNEVARLRLASVPATGIPFVVAPDLFNKDRLSAMIRKGVRPEEHLWHD